MTVSRGLLVLLAASLEALAIGAATGPVPALATIPHAAACLASTAGLRHRLAPAAGAWELLLLASMAFFLPVAGLLGWAGIAWAVPAGQGAGRRPAWVLTPLPPPSQAGEDRGPRRALARRDRRARMDMVLAARAEGPGAVELLRHALRDPDEEVRLLAHAMLERRTRRAWRRIDALTRQLPAAGSCRGVLALQLGSAKWELVRQGLAEGESRTHVLAGALADLRAAQESEGHRASLHYLLGRVHLARGEARAAEAAFRAALAAGLSRRTAAPWLAEAAFAERRLPDIQAVAPPELLVPRLREYWA